MTMLLAPEVGERRYPLAGLRKMIAQKMVRSLHEAAQLSFHAEADITLLLDRRRALAEQGRRISVEDFVLCAYARALAGHRVFNATIEDDLVIEHGAVHVAVAIASPSGLVTPVLRNADHAGPGTLAAQRADLVARAAAGAIKVAEMKGATATLSNLGRSRVRFFTPVLNHPQTSILGIGTIDDNLALDSAAQPVVRHRLGLSLTVDHRLIDGAPAAAFLNEVCDRLEDFGRGGD